FEAYATGLVTNPNCWILGEPGNGKSALIKCLLWRQAAIYGSGPDGRWIAIVDPKGEYATLAEHLGLATVKLSPGGNATINPLAPGPAVDHEPEDKLILRRAEMCTALVGTVLERPLTQLEDAVVFAAVEQLTSSSLQEPTLADVARLVANPTETMSEQLRSNERDLAADTSIIAYALDKLLSRSLRGMFDGRSTVPLRWDGPGIVLDLSAVPLDSDALPLVMVAAAGWFQQLMACPGPQRVQILDEAWALLGNQHTAAYLQTCFKLGRTYGVANICITHRASDLVAQADDGTATSKIAAGLLADSATKIILRQAPDQLDTAAAHFGLTGPETSIVGQLTRGRALWKLGGRTAVVHHIIGRSEETICDTDARMARNRDGFRDSRAE
ncbi:MAG TPA: DUF87 domain-containing protein, partial [Microthrixaceae bacterium]|nr:DUF87 domain-containing protein [Microthrixaceae bacterium]